MQEIIGKSSELLPKELKECKNYFLTYKDKSHINYKRPLDFLKWSKEENLVDFKNVYAKASSTNEKTMPAFAFINNVNYIGIDLDAHRNDFETEEAFEDKKKYNEEILETFFLTKPCYIEISASGEGYHIICKVAEPEIYTTFKSNLEVKTSNNKSYVCLNFAVVQAPEKLEPMDLILEDFLNFTNNGDKVKSKASHVALNGDFAEETSINSTKEEKPSKYEYLNDINLNELEAPFKDTRNMSASELIDFLKSRKDKYGEAFGELFGGNWMPYSTDTPPSQSSADFKFFCLIYCWNKDPEIIRDIYKKSSLYREGVQENGTIKSQPHYFDFSYKRMVEKGVYHYYDHHTFINNSTNASAPSSAPKVSEAKNEEDTEESPYENIYKQCDLSNFIKNYEENKDRASRKYSTGVKSFDFIARNEKGEGGFDTGLNVIVAPSGFGKSLFMMQSAEYIARNNKDAMVLYFNLEMDSVRLCRNNLIRHIYEEFGGEGECDEKSIIENYYRKHSNLMIMPNYFYNYEEILNYVKYIQENKCENVVVFIDYFQKLQSYKTKDFFQRRELLEKMLMDFKIYGNDKQVAFIVASNMSKAQVNELVDETSGKETGDILYSTDSFYGIDLDYKYTKEYLKLNSTAQGKALASENLLRAKRCECKLMRFRNFKLRDGRSGGETLVKLVGREKRFISVDTALPYETRECLISDYENIIKTSLIGTEGHTLEMLLGE